MAHAFSPDIVTVPYKEGANSICIIYSVVKENGQRKYGPPSGWPNPPEGSEVFIGHLPRDCDGKNLLKTFSQVGRIYQLRLMLDFSGFNRGYAFISYTHPAEAAMAVQRFDNFEITPGHKIGVVISKDNRRLTISNLPFSVTAQGVKEWMQTLIPENEIKSVFVTPFSGKIKAILEYMDHRSAAMARRDLFVLFQNTDFFGTGIHLSVDWHNSIPSENTTLFVAGLDPATKEDDLRNLFSFGGQYDVWQVRLIRNYAFIQYASHEQAASALILANSLKAVVGSKVPRHVSWSKSEQIVKSQSKKK